MHDLVALTPGPCWVALKAQNLTLNDATSPKSAQNVAFQIKGQFYNALAHYPKGQQPGHDLNSQGKNSLEFLNHQISHSLEFSGEKWRRDVLDQSWDFGPQEKRRRSQGG